MDRRLWPLAMKIAEVEHFAVQLRAISSLGQKIVDPSEYPFVNQASNNYTAKGWIEKRLERTLPYLTGWIVDRFGRRLEDWESISWARDTCQVIWSEPLKISFSGKERSNLVSFMPLFQEMNAGATQVRKSL